MFKSENYYHTDYVGEAGITETCLYGLCTLLQIYTDLSYALLLTNEQSHVCEKISETTGISFTFHDLRRTFASIANRCGIGMYTVKALINHYYQDDSNITTDYTQIDAKDLRDSMNKIENHILSEEVKDNILNRKYLIKKPNRIHRES
jgi:hypothetical protein